MNSQLTNGQKLLCDFCANALFGEKICPPDNFDVDAVLKEAKYQTVFPLVLTAFKNNSVKSEVSETVILNYITKNVRVSYNHIEIAKLLSQNGVDYVFIKGVASAFYYKQSELRTMGDVDLLIKPCDVQKVNDLLLSIGYATNDDIFEFDKHIGYYRNIKGNKSLCEVHFKINGIPDSLDDIFGGYLSDIFKTAKQISVSNGDCLVPDEFHHGIILLLHTAIHLTSEGIGLRHLCDWAVFVNGFSNDEFEKAFKIPLKEMGLWRFAQLLTLCCQKHLRTDIKEWAGSAEDVLLDDILADIMNGGNFGLKDTDRYGQIKYISNRETHTVNRKGAFSQALSSINAKAKNEYGFVKKCKILLPIGWVAVLSDYLILVLTKKRKLDNINTINSAKHRQSIYKEFKLFEK